eukprot:6882932-Pyramimonas_sp.AAC.1
MVSLVSVWDTTRCDDRLGVLTVVPTDGDVQLVHSTGIPTAVAGAFAKFRNHDHPYCTGVSYMQANVSTCTRATVKMHGGYLRCVDRPLWLR